MSLFSVLSVGTRALQASQLGMNITGQNISNADVEGYSRKRLNQQADYRYDGLYGQMGFGVVVESIERIRDIHIDNQIRKQNHQFGRFDAVDIALETVENILKEPSDSGIQHYMGKFFDSFDNLANNPSDEAARTMVKTEAETLVGVFHNFSFELEQVKTSKNFEIETSLEEVNKIAKEIFALNGEITSIELNGQNANDSRDRRDNLLKELSKIIEFDHVENAAGDITVTTGGNILVSAVTVNALETYEDKTNHITSDTGDVSYNQYGIRVKQSKVAIEMTGGKLKGLVEVRDEIIPKYEAYLDELAKGLVTSVNEQHRQGYNLRGYTGFDFFDPTQTTAKNIAVSASVSSDVANIAAAKGGSVNLAVQNNIPSGALNFGNPAVQLSDDGVWPVTSANEIRNIVKGSIVVETATGVKLEEGVDYAVNYRNGTIQTLHNGYDNTAISVNFEYMSGNFPGPGNNENAIKMGQLRDKLTMNADFEGNGTATYGEFYSSKIGELGLQRDEAASNKFTREHLIQEYENSQDSIAGVSLDEEMANLVKFQHTYQAAARIITTAQAMLDILMKI